MRPYRTAIVLLILAIILFLWWRHFHQTGPGASPLPVAPSAPLIPAAPETAPPVNPPATPKTPAAKIPTAAVTNPEAVHVPLKQESMPPLVSNVVISSKTVEASAVPPPVILHKELIPKDIEIVRIYFPNNITGPGSEIQFDIDGSGFNKEFEKMIQMESGSPFIQVNSPTLITPNQIHGLLTISTAAPTAYSYPRVLIDGNTVFQASDPFAVIRPEEVLTLIFLEQDATGTQAKFRVFTNLTPETYSAFTVIPSTPAISVSNLKPILPFIVDGIFSVGPGADGYYGAAVELGGKTIWQRDGMIHVVRPNVGAGGLIVRIQSVDDFHRPGDLASFHIFGSGFQPEDIELLRPVVAGLSVDASTFTYVSSDHLDLTFAIPGGAPVGVYPLALFQADKSVFNLPEAIHVVGANWMRSFRVAPALHPGETSAITLVGRDLTLEFVEGLHVGVYEPGLQISPFQWMSPEESIASISAAPSVAPGDYLLKLTDGSGQPVHPQSGSIIQVFHKP